MSEENVEVIRRCVTSLVDGDYSFIEKVIDPGFVLDLSRNAINPDVYHGFDGVLRMAEGIREIWDHFDIALQEFVDGGDQIVVAVHISGVGKGSGVPVDMLVFQVWTFRDGKVIQVAGGYRDRHEALEAAGLSE